MRIVYLSCIPLTRKVAKDWLIDHLIASGVEVQYWDITTLVRGEVTEHRKQETSYSQEIRDKAALQEAIALHQEAVFVLLLPKIWQFRWVFRLLTAKRCKTVAFRWGALPAERPTSSSNILRLLRSPKVLLSKIRNRLRALVLSRPGYIRPYDLVFAAGRVMLEKSDKANRTIPIAHFDYDQFGEVSRTERLVEGRYALFLDNYLPFHSDHALTGLPRIAPAEYYETLHRFFLCMERQHGLKVVIAAHPRAAYANDEFRGRQTVFGKTLELTANAELILFHASTSVSYAVLASKPAWAIYTDEMENLYSHTYMRLVRSMADYLGAPTLNISKVDESSIPPLAQPDLGRYENYVKDFLASEGIGFGDTKEVFLREIKKLAAH